MVTVMGGSVLVADAERAWVLVAVTVNCAWVLVAVAVGRE